MTRRSSVTKQKKSRRPTSEIPDANSNSIPNSSADSHRAPDQEVEGMPQNRLPTFVVLLINFVIIYVGTVLIGNWVMLPCLTSQGSALSVVCLFLIIFHIIWRFAYPVMYQTKEEATVKLPVIQIPLSVFISILNSAHPWKLNRFGFALFLLFFGSVMPLNLTAYSPFRTQDQPFAIQGFSVQRSHPTALEELAPGDTLMLRAGESVITKVLFIGEAQVSCIWFIKTKSNTVETGCSIDYTALTSGINDILSVYVQPACGVNGKSESLFIAVQASTE